MKHILTILILALIFVANAPVAIAAGRLQFDKEYVCKLTDSDMFYEYEYTLSIRFRINNTASKSSVRWYLDYGDPIPFDADSVRYECAWSYLPDGGVKIVNKGKTGSETYIAKIIDDRTIKIKDDIYTIRSSARSYSNNQSSTTSTAYGITTPAGQSASRAIPTNAVLNGYFWEWDGYRGKSKEKEQAKFEVHTGKNHYLQVNHGINVTNLSPSRYNRVKWSTRKGAIKVSMPKNVEIKTGDEIVCWEQNGSSTDSGYRVVVLFIWTPSTSQLQCLRTTRRHHAGRTIDDIYYFRTINSGAWSKIRPMLMQELPYCGTRIN